MDNSQPINPGNTQSAQPQPSAQSQAAQPQSNTPAPKSPSKHSLKNSTLYIIIAALVVIIAVVLIFIFTRPQTSDTSDTTNTADTSDIAPVYVAAIDVQTDILSKFNEDGDVDTLVASYQIAIDDAITQSDYDLAATLIDYRTSDLLSINYCDQAMQLLLDDDVSAFDTSSLALFYTNAMSSSLFCENNESYQLWSNAYNSLASEVQYE